MLKLSTLFHSQIGLLPFHRHTLHRHGHAARTATATRELVAFEGDDALLASAEVNPIVDHIRGCYHVEARVVEGLQGALVASIAEELTRSEAEEVATAVPLFAGGKCVVTVATKYRFKVQVHILESRKQVGCFRAHGFLSVDGDVEGLERTVHDDRLVNHAFVHPAW